MSRKQITVSLQATAFLWDQKTMKSHMIKNICKNVQDVRKSVRDLNIIQEIIKIRFPTSKIGSKWNGDKCVIEFNCKYIDEIPDLVEDLRSGAADGYMEGNCEVMVNSKKYVVIFDDVSIHFSKYW